MKLYRHQEEILESDKGCVVALGNFDGFHRGHHVVIGEAARIAKNKGLNLAVVVTEPHPVSFFQPSIPPFRLTAFRTRAQLLEQFGVDILLVLQFDKQLASLEAEDFIDNILLDGLGAQHVCVGYDHRFGSKRRGDVSLLRSYGEEKGYEVSVVDPVIVGIDGYAGEIYSSTLVRKALAEGRSRKAAALLGHWWSVNGRVCEGDKRGRTIGFPTANVELGECMKPKLGVYAIRATVDEEGNGSSPIWEGVANIGKRPTFDKRDILLEVHLFNFDQEIYGKHIRVEFVAFLRPEQKFKSLDSLKQQIQQDCHVARVVLNEPDNDRNRLQSPTIDQYLSYYPAAFAQT